MRGLQKLTSNARGVAFAVSNSIAKGSQRSKAALLPLAPPGLGWRAAAAGGGGAGDAGGGEGRDVLHTFVAGYSLILQAALRAAAGGVEQGRPLRGALRAAAGAALQAAALPLLVALEVAESAAGSVRALAAEGQGGGGALRVPRYVHPRQLLRPYDPLESLGRALLYHSRACAPFRDEALVGCAPAGPPGGGRFAVVTTHHMLLVACRPGPGGGPLFQRPALQQVLRVGEVLSARPDGPALRVLCVPPWARSRLHPAAAAAAAAATASADGGASSAALPGTPDPLTKWFVCCLVECSSPAAATRLRTLLLEAGRRAGGARRLGLGGSGSGHVIAAAGPAPAAPALPPPRAARPVALLEGPHPS
jgi:hypothetical protein